MTHDVRHDVSARAFVADVEGTRCVLEYHLDGNVMAIVHTRVPDEVAGRGIAAGLTRAALDSARASGWKVRPDCSYARAFLDRNAAYSDLLAASESR